MSIMQYFGCCPNPEGNDTIETTLTTQQFSARSALHAAHGTSLHNRRHSMESPSTTLLNGTDCNAPVNPYRVLELRRDATPSEIIGSYRKLALMYHPGRKISCPLERKKRVQFFEVLAACYETLMHSEFRRKCDILLKDMDKKHSSQMTKRQPKQLQNNPLPFSFGSNNLAIKGADSIPGLVPSTSQSSSASGGARNNQSVGGSEESNDTLLRNNCTSLGGILVCAGGPRALTASSSINKTFTISRDGSKGFKSLADSSSLSASQSQGSTEEEGEIHFSEATVNRLFGGPMASLHRARNFQAFSDPYLVFDKVFGNKKPIFPRVTMADVLTTADKSMEGAQVENRHETGISNNALRSSASHFSHPGLEPYSLLGKNQNDDLSANTRVFVSSRIVNGRIITKTETVHVNPATGVASVNVTVDGEYLQPVISKKKSSKLYGTSVADWLLCFGTAKVTPATRSEATENINNSSQTQSSICCLKGQSESASEEKELASSCHSFKSLYVEALEEFYLCNENFHEECNKYMRCGRP